MLGSVLGSVVWFPAARPAARKGFCGLWRKIKKTASACGIRVWGGGRARARTVDPLIKSQLLYQLSYAPAIIFGSGGWIRTTDITGMNRVL